MSLSALISHIKKKVLGQLFKLRKIRRVITTKCAISILKQKVLPIFDYEGFMLYSINQADKFDLQVIQNDGLRTCYNVNNNKEENYMRMLNLLVDFIIPLIFLHVYMYRRTFWKNVVS